MANKSEPNAQNSEIDPAVHPSGARIENMIADHQNQKTDTTGSNNVQQPAKHKGEHYMSPEEPAEGSREVSTEAPHRMDADDRTSR